MKWREAMSEGLIDKQAFETLKSMTDPGFIVELIDVFLSDTPDQIELIRVGIATGNAEQVRRAAHSLKSNSASFGANRLAGMSREIEMVAKASMDTQAPQGTQGLQNANTLLVALVNEYEKLVPTLQELKNEC
jgi:histidine phosphotransfer protein HptB